MAEIIITVNGVQRRVPENFSAGDLLLQLGLDSERVAVAVDEKVIGRDRLTRRRLRADEQVEIIHFVGGG